jgi:transcriptional regulator of aromatic amino acid metabolism
MPKSRFFANFSEPASRKSAASLKTPHTKIAHKLHQ